MTQLNPRYETIFKMNHIIHQPSNIIHLTDECQDDFIKEALYAGLYKQGVTMYLQLHSAKFNKE